MTTAILDGPLGLEAKHIWLPPRGPGFTFNDLTSALPNTKCKKITGIHDLAEADNLKYPNTAQGGVSGLPSYERENTITYEGRLRAIDQPTLSAYRNLLRGSMRERSDYGIMVIQPHVDYGAVVWAYRARVLELTIDDVVPFPEPGHIPSDYQRDFIASFEMHDPRFLLWSEEQLLEGLASGFTANVTNRGWAEADPVFEINVTAAPASIQLYNSDVQTSNDTARIRLLDPDGGTVPNGLWTVDFTRGERKILYEGDDYSYFFDGDYSQWWDEGIPGLQPGENSVQVIGGVWSIRFRDRT